MTYTLRKMLEKCDKRLVTNYGEGVGGYKMGGGGM